MGAKVVIEHNQAGWIEVFKSEGMQRAVDQAGERIAQEAGEGFTYYKAHNNQFTVAGFVSSSSYEAAYLEATDKVLTKAVHG